VNGAPDPHDATVNLIVAASSETVRRELVELTQSAHFGVRSVAQDPAGLETLLRSDRSAWVVTGGTLTLLRPFLSPARTANAAVVAVLAGRTDSEDRTELGYGRLAVLRAVPPIETFQAASIASRAGLNVWDPGLGSPADAPESIETPLSPRERTVLELTGAGLSTKAVARRLGISPNTVKFHLQAAFEKLGAASRAEAVMAAIRRGELAV
jgi:DNA-binding CsgD family transcriptional regulator